MSYDTSNPGDSDVISGYPSNERALRQFLELIMSIDHDAVPGGTQGME